jgi:L,D-transpeptidase catalytic domain
MSTNILRPNRKFPLAVGVELSTQNARRCNWGAVRDGGRASGIAMALNCALALALASSPVTARTYARHKFAQKDHKQAEHVSKEPFGDVRKGPQQIFISIDQQKLHLYSDGVHVADTSVATGVLSLPTPLGVFSVIQKQVFHRSNIYSNAPMPFMQRITWSGVAMHEGENIGHRASHGCIRMPREFAMRLYSFTRLGARVIIANSELKPADFADPHLFVHKDKPPEQAAVPPAESVKTAQSVDGDKTTDAAAAAPVAAGSAAPSSDPPADPAPLKPDEIGLRGGKDNVAAASDAASEPAKPATPAPADANAPPAPVSAAPADAVPMPAAKPADLATSPAERKTQIAIFVSRKEKKIYVRQNFEPLFDASITIVRPEQPLGTHVFTALEYLDDHATFRWNVVSLPGEPPKPARNSESDRHFEKSARARRRGEAEAKPAAAPPPPQSPAEALARIDIPQDVIDHISQMMVPGSSLIVSDQGLGDETGEGTDFIVVTR